MRMVGRWGWVVLAIAIGACAPNDFSDADPGFADGEVWDEVDLDELDDFARDHLVEVQEISIEAGVEYCGLYGYDADGELAATTAVRGEPDSCNPWNEPDEFVVIASYHTHGSYSPDADSEVPSTDDLEGDIEEGIYGYISTPGGRLWFNDWETESATVIDPGAIQPDPDFQDCPAFPAGTDYTLPELEAREDEDPGEC
ncbi:MAG: DUF4329 domain-containing protein [Leptolyngbyaceae cyanobacterium]